MNPKMTSAALAGFVTPDGSNQQDVEFLLNRSLEIVIDFLSHTAESPSLPDKIDPQTISDFIPRHPVSNEKLFDSIRLMLEGAMNPANPRYLGHMDPLPTTGSIAGELVAAAVNNNLLSHEMSPFFSQLEQQLMKRLAAMFGLPETAGGMMQGGGSLCNLLALTVARNTALNVHEKGLVGLACQPVILTSELAHSSIQKASMIIGLGEEHVIPIPVDRQCRMDLDALHETYQRLIQSRQKPIAVVATAGSTVTGSIDPLAEIADFCKENDLWFHVDASYGGAVIFSEKWKHKLTGCERADSITFNPQKWCYVTKACATVFFRNYHTLLEHFRIHAPYMNLHEDDDEVNLGELGVQGTRAADVAKLWMTLLQLGQSGLEDLVDLSFEMTDRFLSHTKQNSQIELACDPAMNLICFRWNDGKEDEETLAEINGQLQRYLMEQENTFFSLPWFRGSRWLKAVLLNPFTSDEDFQSIFAAIDRFTGGRSNQSVVTHSG